MPMSTVDFAAGAAPDSLPAPHRGTRDEAVADRHEPASPEVVTDPAANHRLRRALAILLAARRRDDGAASRSTADR
jgi:hypothetical protein